MVEAKFQPLVDELTNLTSASSAAVALINSMAADVLAAKDDPAEIEEIVTGYKAVSKALGDAVAANTTPPPAPEPGPTPTERGGRR